MAEASHKASERAGGLHGVGLGRRGCSGGESGICSEGDSPKQIGGVGVKLLRGALR